MGTKYGVGVAALLIGSGAGLLAWQQSKHSAHKPAPVPVVADARQETSPPVEGSPAPEPSRPEAPVTPTEHPGALAADHSLASASPSPVVGPTDTSERSFRPMDPPAPEAAHSTLFPEPVSLTPASETPPVAEASSTLTHSPVAEMTPPSAAMKDSPAARTLTPPTSAPAAASKVVTHVVALGETYSSIAQKYYGSSKYTNLLVKANPGKDPRKLQPGAKLTIPDGPRREASASPKEVMPEASGERLHTPTGSAPPVASDRAYTVKPGETWHVLAQRFLRDAKRWPELYEMNVERAPRNPDGLRAGTVIELPAGIKPTTNPS